MLALKDGRCALEAHARINGGLWQVDLSYLAIGTELALILHEYEVPNFDEAVPVLIRRARRAAGNIRAVVKENFGTGSARSCIAHRPEIIIGRNADDTLIGKSSDLLPQIKGHIIRVVNRHQQLILGETEILSHQIPSMLNGLSFEIVSKAEIAQHFKKCVMARRVSNIVQIIMLTAGPNAFLRGDRARKFRRERAGEVIFKLHHPRIHKEQCRIIIRHKRRTRRNRVANFVEETQILGTDISKRRHKGNP